VGVYRCAKLRVFSAQGTQSSHKRAMLTPRLLTPALTHARVRAHRMVFEGIRRMIDMNPDWTWKVYEHDDIDAYIRAEPDRPGAMLSHADVDLVLKAHFVEHTDAARLLIMWHEGGFYQDTDRAYVILSLSHCCPLLANDTCCCCLASHS
jgi:hypothetical protein